MPFDDFVKLLHFEDEAEGTAFLQQYGVETNGPEILRSQLIEPDSQLSPRRSTRLVESKLTTPVGEAVFGKPLPPNVALTPTSSFNNEGYFIGIVKEADPVTG